jgi:MYXO-CTERM domain-containing protein
MDQLNDLAPGIAGLGILAFVLLTLRRIRREQTRSRKEREAAE